MRVLKCLRILVLATLVMSVLGVRVLCRTMGPLLMKPVWEFAGKACTVWHVDELLFGEMFVKSVVN